MIFFYLIFLLCVNISSAKEHLYSNSTRDWAKLSRKPRKADAGGATEDYKKEVFECDKLWRTGRHPFVVIMLYKTSGQFLGMGSIIDKNVVLTAKKITEKAVNNPHELLALGGYMLSWWGKHSQVKHARNIHVHSGGLALVELDEEFDFNENVLPVTIATYPEAHDFGTFKSKWGSSWGFFGIPRSIWDTPGEPLDKLDTYIMEVEDASSDLENCFKAYPDMKTNKSTMFCSDVKSSYSWGTLGSPTVAYKDGKTVQIGIIIGTSRTDEDQYHLQLKTGPYEFWIKSFTTLTIPTTG